MIRRNLMVMLALTIVFRVVWIATTWDRPLVGDELSYDGIAFNIATGHGYQAGATDAERHPTAWRGPSYVLFVAGMYVMFGRGLAAPVLVQVLFEVATCLLLFYISSRWFRHPAVGLVAVAIYAVYPPFIRQTGALLSESFTNLTLLGSIALFQKYLDSRRARTLVLSGALVGVCALNKTQLVPLAVLLPLLASPELRLRGVVRAIAGMLLATALIMSPWVIRNAVTFRAFLPGVSTGGLAFWGGSGPIDGKTIGGLDHPAVPDSLRTRLATMDELEASRWLMRDALRVIINDPKAYAVLTVRKFFRLWLNVGFDKPPSLASYAVAVFHILLFTLAWIAVRSGFTRRVAVRMIVGLGVFWSLSHIPFFTVVRYSLPCIVLLLPFASAGILSLFLRATRARSLNGASVIP